MLKTCASSDGVPSADPLLTEAIRITKMRENCLKQFDEHWNCLEANNQVRSTLKYPRRLLTIRAGILPV